MSFQSCNVIPPWFLSRLCYFSFLCVPAASCFSGSLCVVEVTYFWLFSVLLWKFISHAFLSVFLSSLCHCLDSIQLCFVTLLFPLPLLSINSLSVTVADCGVTVWRRTQNAGLLWWALNLLLLSGKKHNYIQIPILWPLWKFFLNPTHSADVHERGKSSNSKNSRFHTVTPKTHSSLQFLEVSRFIYAHKGFHTKSTAVLASLDLRIQHCLELSRNPK